MNIELEHLHEIPKIMELLTLIQSTLSEGRVEKRWLNTRELAVYTGYKYETIKAKIKSGDFIRDLHYFKKGGILLFDKIEVDNWVMGKKSANNLAYQKENLDEVVNDIVSSFIV